MALDRGGLFALADDAWLFKEATSPHFGQYAVLLNLLFEEPFYALLGGLHYPLEEARNISWMHKYFVVDKLPWETLSLEDVQHNIDILKTQGVQIVGVSGHDSSDSSIELFRKAFGENYVDIVVGESISLNR